VTVLIEYDPEADAVFASFRQINPGEDQGARTLDDNRLIHYDASDEVVGIEFLRVSDGIDLTDIPRADEIAAALRAFPKLQPAA
jgi:uncharacterized protein YuzE